jgi:methylmalonyl-CoA mutase
LEEFDRITERGGVPGAMETMYQRSSKIQEESMHYEMLTPASSPIIGVTLPSPKQAAQLLPRGNQATEIAIKSRHK